MSHAFQSNPRWYHAIAMVVAILASTCGTVFFLYTGHARYLVTGVTLALGLCLWAGIDPFIHGHWFNATRAAARWLYQWSSTSGAWRRLGARVVVYGVPMAFRTLLPAILPHATLVVLAIIVTLVGTMYMAEPVWRLGFIMLTWSAAIFFLFEPTLKWGARIFESRLKKEKAHHYPAFRNWLAARGL